MTDHDLLAGTIAARLRLLPPIERLYPPRRGAAGLVASATGLLAAVADDPTVDVRSRHGALVIEASIGVTEERPALTTAIDAIAAVRASLPDGAAATVRLRIASIG